jgi:hypothetical protein
VDLGASVDGTAGAQPSDGVDILRAEAYRSRARLRIQEGEFPGTRAKGVEQSSGEAQPIRQ